MLEFQHARPPGLTQTLAIYGDRMTQSGQTPVRVYRAADAVPGALAGESVAVSGYGHLGRAAALNLRDSGAKVRIGNREDEYAELARTDGFEVVPIAAAAVDDVAYVLLPDEVIPTLFDSEIAPALRPGSAIELGLPTSQSHPYPSEGAEIQERLPMRRAIGHPVFP